MACRKSWKTETESAAVNVNGECIVQSGKAINGSADELLI